MSICKGIGQIVDKHLGFTAGDAPLYVRDESCTQLNKVPAGFNAHKMLSEMLEQIERNRAASPNGKADNNKKQKKASEENWRFEKQPNFSSENPSLEKILEKNIVNVSDSTWVNQVPTSSGLYNSKNDKKRCFDLVHRMPNGDYEFIELKVASNNPLMAAMECLIYGVLYIYARLNPELFKTGQELLSASEIHLQVLAPKEFYQKYERTKLDWLPIALNEGLNKLLDDKKLQRKLKMDFAFTAFPDGFTSGCDKEELRKTLESRKIVWSK